MVRSLIREARLKEMREAGNTAGIDEESEGEELRKAVEVNRLALSLLVGRPTD